MKKLICFGDSITAREINEDGSDRLTPRLRKALPDWTVLNMGVSGDNTRDALARLQRDVLCHVPDLVIILLGSNDAASHKQVPLKEYRTNLLEMVTRISPEKAVLISPSPVDEKRPRNRTNLVLEEYSNAVQGTALRTGCRFINLFAQMSAFPGYETLLSDGLHLTSSGYTQLTRILLEGIAEK